MVEGKSESNKIELPSNLTVGDLAAKLNLDSVDVIKQLMRAGYMLSINQKIEYELASLISKSFGFTPLEIKEYSDETQSLKSQTQGDEIKPPVVTILGHVDHGKTTLLDKIRQTAVAESEFGGITQKLSAYKLKYKDSFITFLDTPGHEAFSTLRSRGAKVTDIAIIIIAADDGIMPQTEESIKHAQAAGVPMIIAISKIDLPGADVEKVKSQLAERDMLIEEWGGEIICVPVSSPKGEGVAELLDYILLVAEVSELKTNTKLPVRAVVLESSVDDKQGILVKVLIQEGILKVGDRFVLDTTKGKVRALINDKGKQVKSSSPSTPIDVLGFESLPFAGEILQQVDNEKEAKTLLAQKKKLENNFNYQNIDLTHASAEQKSIQTINIILKTDLQGSLDALTESLNTFNKDGINIALIHHGVGNINENDISLAVASQSVIYGFNVRVEKGAIETSKQESIDVQIYSIIYELIDAVELKIKESDIKEDELVKLGLAEIKAVFPSNNMLVAGVLMQEGKVNPNNKLSILRNGKEVFFGKVNSLKHYKDDVKELVSGQEGGIGIDEFQQFKVGDFMEFYI